MRKLFLGLALLPSFVLLAGCPKKDTTVTDGNEAGVSEASVDAAVAAAKNAADVARFPSERPVADDALKITDPFTQAKTGPKSGNLVASLKPGTDPFKIAEFQDCVLVTFPDPKDATVTLMGWIPKAAFVVSGAADAGSKDASADAADAAVVDAAVAAVDAGGKTALKCPAGQEAVVNVVVGGAAACRKKCSADKDCKAATAGSCVPASTQSGRIAKVCAADVP